MKPSEIRLRPSEPSRAEGELPSAGALSALAARCRRVRAASLDLAAPLAPEEQTVQTMPDVSPTKWHLAHTTWFFETFLLRERLAGYRPLDERYGELFNSYYKSVGAQYPRAERGLLARPTVAEVHAYRAHVDAGLERLFERGLDERGMQVLELGLNHEQQHQELLLTDAKHVLSQGPMGSVYRPRALDGLAAPPPLAWHGFEEGLIEIGHGGAGFAFDNESPRHRTFVHAFELAGRAVSQGEFLAFVEDGGYRRHELWLADGWDRVQSEGWRAPLYWVKVGGEWRRFSLAGERPLEAGLPAAHISFFEADAYARWAGARLPTEAEWELAATRAAAAGESEGGAFLDCARFDPAPLEADTGVGRPARLVGDVWEWTCSSYAPYPRFRPLAGSLGEYNGKFMCSQMVCRGGSCATFEEHVRLTYRNFFYPHQRWQFTGLRLARDP